MRSFSFNMKRHKLELCGVVLQSFVFMFIVYTADALQLTKTSKTYAKFPKWNACNNASLSFEFKTSEKEALLMYTDDSGRFDYVEILLVDSRVRLRMNIVDGREGSIEIVIGERLNDNRWHKVEIQRNRMETTLYVDGRSDSRVAFGSDFNFGNLSRNNYVFFGGLPSSYQRRLESLSLPSAYFEPRFEGSMRNIIYGNCTCMPTRAGMIDGDSVTMTPREACDVEDNCGNCLCISGDDGPGCQCVGFNCQQGADRYVLTPDLTTYYHLPMDRIRDQTLVNPSGLDAKVTGYPEIFPGVVDRALKIDGRTQKITVSGPGHRDECFGNLKLCKRGYTISFWANFESEGQSEEVYLSNGGQNANSHGVAMLYQTGRLVWIFRMLDGEEWRVAAYDVLPRHWYHVAVTWEQNSGLSLYINGEKVARKETPVNRASTALPSTSNDFVIGRANDDEGSRDAGTMTIDEFEFWSRKLSENEIRETAGAVYHYYLPMDQLVEGQIIVPNLEPKTIGRLPLVSGKIGRAVSLNGRGEHIDLGSFSDTCLGNVTMCKYGFTVSFWISFQRLRDNSYYMASGVTGFAIFSYGNRLYANVHMDDRQWQTSVSGIQKDRWYFLEVTWSEKTGLRMYVNQELTSEQSQSTHEQSRSSFSNNFYIGRANSPMHEEKYGAAIIDEVEIFNADRDRLLFLDYIQRGKPRKSYYGFDQMIADRITHASTLIRTFGSPKLVPGKIDKALRLSGRLQKAEFEHTEDSCLGNLDLCHHGVLLSLWLRFDKLEEGMYYISTGINGITVSFVDKKLRVKAATTTREWKLSTGRMVTGEWHYLEMSWDPASGLKLYVDDELHTESTAWQAATNNYNARLTNRFILGNLNNDKSGSIYGAATYDALEYWFGPRDYLLAFGYIQRGKPSGYILHMDETTDGGRTLVHPSLPITLHGSPSLVPGRIDNAVRLNGGAQYIDLGNQMDKCLGNLEFCYHGLTISFWVKFSDFTFNMYLLSTGENGIRMYHFGGYVYLKIDHKGKSWRVSLPRPESDKWHYLELSWHPEFGLSLFLDYELRDHEDYVNIPSKNDNPNIKFLIGSPNSGDTLGQRFNYAAMEIDEMEIWYGRREELLAFGYIVRDTVGHESFSMETATNDVIDHPRFRVTLERGARLVPGKIGNAVSLQGRGQYVDVGEHMDKCLANLERCYNGLTVSLWLNARQLGDNTYFLSSPTYSLYYKDRQLKSKFAAGGKEWRVGTQNFNEGEWHNVMLSWEQEKGLSLYMDGQEVSQDTQPTDIMLGDEPETEAKAEDLYFGRSTNPRVRNTANAVIDDVQFWYANLERLRAQGLFGGQLHEVIQLGQIDASGKLVLPKRTISLEGGASRVQGEHGRAIKLDGKGQYVSLGENLTCGGNLDDCKQGFTMRFSAKPGRLVNNMYFLDSFPVTIFYKDGKLYATVRTSSKTWTVAAPGFKTGEWQIVDVSWHPEIGLTMFVNDEEVGAHKTHGTEQEVTTDWDRRTFFGRALTNMKNERYADTTVENFEVWNVRRDVLLANNQLNTPSQPDPNPQPQPRPLPQPRPTDPVAPVTTSTSAPNDQRSTYEEVVVTRLPITNSQQLRPVLPGASQTSKIIRFLGNSFIRYDFGVLTAEMLSPSNKESLSMQFITQDEDGLIWLFEGSGNDKLHLSVKGGKLLFVIDDGARTPQQVLLTPPNSGKVSDFRWHPVKIEKEGRVLKFYIDDQYITQLTARSDVQFVAPGKVYLGGTPTVSADTGNLVTSNIDGAITNVTASKFTRPARELLLNFLQFLPSGQEGEFEVIDGGEGSWVTRPPPTQVPVESRKFTRPERELIISFLQFVDAADKSGDLQVFDWEQWKSGNWTWSRTTKPPPTQPPEVPSPVTFTSGNSAFFLRDPLDMRRGGSYSFRFRTSEPRGVISIARGAAQSVNFMAIEIFDGILYFVYDFGTFSSRMQLSDQRMDDGEWHEVSFRVEGNQMLVTVDNKQFPTTLPPTEIARLYFYRLYIGGYDDMKNAPWPLYSRQGYKGCLESFRVNDIGVNLHDRFRDSNIQDVEIGCRGSLRRCRSQPCVNGFCRDTMNGYVCECSSTPYTGQNCGAEAVIGSWDGSQGTNFEFINRDVTHTNDISFRFLTPLRNTLLFKTEVGSNIAEDYIQAELVDGIAKVTFNAGGQKKTLRTGENLNDYFWHTLYIRRRADDVQVWVDDETPTVSMIGGEKYNIKIDRIKFGSLGRSSNIENYIGYLQNFIYDGRELLGELKRQSSNVVWIEDNRYDNLPLLTYKPMTITTSETYVNLPTMRVSRTMKLLFKFKTKEANGVILYNTGSGRDAIALELTNGLLRLAYNQGGRNVAKLSGVPYKLNDNQWHTVQVSRNENGQITLRVDSTRDDVSVSDGNGRLDLQSGNLYIGGLPKSMFKRPAVTGLIESRQGFRGCLASIDLNGMVPDLMSFATEKQYLLNGCTDLDVGCNQPGVCGAGVCMSGIDGHWCDCNMTGYIGTNACDELPIGYYFGNNTGNGILLYEFPLRYQVDSSEDRIAFGFKTFERDGVLYRLESSVGDEFIEIRLEDGFVKAISKTSADSQVLEERSRIFSDGQYHVVRFVRLGDRVSLQVDSLKPRETVIDSGRGLVFDKVYKVILGGRVDNKGVQSQNFYGILGGAYWGANGIGSGQEYRWLNMYNKGTNLHGGNVVRKGNVLLTKTYLLYKRPEPATTPKPPKELFFPPLENIPPAVGGGGVVEDIGGTGGVVPPAVGGPGGELPGGPSLYVPGEPVPLAAALVGPPVPGVAGARAGPIVGTILGTLAFLSSLTWAFYKMKPGIPAFLSPGAASVAGGPVQISAPRATSNLGAVQAASQTGGAGGAGSTKLTVVNGTGGGAGGGSTTYTSYYSSTSSAVSGGGAGAGDAVDSSTLRATGTFSNKGTALGTPKAGRAGMSSSSYSANYQSQSSTMGGYGGGESVDFARGGDTLGGTYDRQYMTSTSSTHGGQPDYDLPVGSGTLQPGYSTSTLNTAYNYQVRGEINNGEGFSLTTIRPKTYTSALTLIVANPNSSNIRHEIYSPTAHSSAHHEYVDRAEDIIVEASHPLLMVKPSNLPHALKEQHANNEYVTINVSDTSSYATYKSTKSESHEVIDTKKTTKQSSTLNIKDLKASSGENMGPFADTKRKASLQITQMIKPRTDGYERLESYASETSVNISSSNLDSWSREFVSEDNIYESTATINSTLRSDSMENTLSSLEGEMDKAFQGRLDLLMQDMEGYDTTTNRKASFDSIEEVEYSAVNKTKKISGTYDNDYFTQEKPAISAASGVPIAHLARKSDDKLSALFVPHTETDRETLRSETVIEVQNIENITRKATNISSPESSEITEITEKNKTMSLQKPKRKSKESQAKLAVNKNVNKTSSAEENIILQHKDSTSTTDSSFQLRSTGKEPGVDYSAELNKQMEGMMLGLNMNPSKWFELDQSADSGQPTDDWTVQNLKTVTLNRQGQYVLSGGAMGAVTPGAAADEVRVDCCLMTNDGRNVVTGSSQGPPQVWDMANGELLRIMKGDTIGSTDLHLVCNDRLLVGAVHADMEINEYSGRKGVFNHTLQIWDFVSGKPLSMAEGEYCSALCPMSDSDKVLFGKTDKFGDATSIIAWDLMGNQMIKKMRYEAPIGNNDYINFLALSKNDRYVVAGFTNSFDNFVEFMVFDMTLTSYEINEPAMLKLDANSDCTAILPKDEAVTGLRNGDLVIWSIRTGQPSRQLLGAGGAHAHTREIKSVTLSDDGKYLVSASADGTLKVWDMHTERPIHTLTGHSDEVWCSSISPDNEIVVSGSSDGTIRLWRMKNGSEMCVFNCGIDIFFVTMSHDKGTIVALGDKYGARKLIMLQVVRTKIKKIVSS